MMALKKVLTDIKNRIPKEVLDLAFMVPSRNLEINTTLDNQIISLVLKPIVLQDCNVIRGISFNINLNYCTIKEVAVNGLAQGMIIEVPYQVTNNKEIISPISLSFRLQPSHLNSQDNELLGLANVAINNITTEQKFVTTANLSLIGPNTILVNETLPGNTDGVLRVTVENDILFNNINYRTAKALSDLSILATKGYIYNSLVVEIDKSYIYAGHEINKVGEIISSYENAWEEYDTYLKEKWTKISFMNDNDSHHRFIKAMINPIV